MMLHMAYPYMVTKTLIGISQFELRNEKQPDWLAISQLGAANSHFSLISQNVSCLVSLHILDISETISHISLNSVSTDELFSLCNQARA